MKKSEVYISLLVDLFKKHNISKFVFTSEIEHTFLIEKVKELGKFYKVNDARTAGYIATGISAELKMPVVVLSSGSNESRSLMCGATEAYYRNLPVLIITFGSNNQVDNSREIKDTFKSSFNLSLDLLHNSFLCCLDSAFNSLVNEKMPVHISLDLSNDREFSNCDIVSKKEIQQGTQLSESILKELSKVLTQEDYLFISKKYITNGIDFDCKVNDFSDYNDKEGAVSLLIGASLANCHKKYIELISEEELLQDLNSLGNRHISRNMAIIVLIKDRKELIDDYATSLGFLCIDGFNVEILKKTKDKPIIVFVKE